MAIVKIQSAVVERVFSGGKGYAVAEKFKTRDGEDADKKFTVWFDEPQDLPVGAVASFSGLYSDKIEDFEGKNGPARTIRRNINSAKIDGDVQVPAGEESPF